MPSAVNSGDTAWVLVSAALVFVMIPGLAFFYGGMLRSRAVVNMLMMVMGAVFVVGILWVAFGYSVAFGGDPQSSPFLGSLTEYAWLDGLMVDDPQAALPAMAFVGFQAMFACITVGLIAGSVAERMKFSAWLAFAAVWATLVYFPVAHWVWAAGGWIMQLGVIDFAGGTAVHVNAGAAGLALALVLGRRLGWPRASTAPGNLPLVMIGAGLLWFGWFGFNAGSALAANNTSAVVFVNTFVATCAAALAWLLVERLREGRTTSLGAASGVVAGLVAITPSCSAVSPMGATLVGVAAGVLCAFAVGLKYRLRYDDSLDVVGVHLVGGLVGTLLIGLVATADAPAGVDGLLYGGGLDQLGRQAIGAIAVLAYSLGVAAVVARGVDAVLGLRIAHEQEARGVDLVEHGERAYDWPTDRAADRAGGVAGDGDAYAGARTG